MQLLQGFGLSKNLPGVRFYVPYHSDSTEFET